MSEIYSLDSYDYFLPEELIAQHPAAARDQSRLMVFDRETGSLVHRYFRHISSELESGDCMVMNNTRVFPARIHARRGTGGKVEFFLLHYPHKSGNDCGTARVSVLTRSSKPLKPGQVFNAGDFLRVEMICRRADGSADVLLHFSSSLDSVLAEAGETPLPPYIKRDVHDPSDASRYQTVYARETGSVAAPTAGLHFTDAVLDALRSRGVRIAEITLHVGYGTFAPVRAEDIREHEIHSEYTVVPESACRIVNETRKTGGRVVAVGTTSVRSLEWAVDETGILHQRHGQCSLYIMPGFRFRAVDAMITNFHLPRSSLLILVSAFAGRDRILDAYREAVRKRYRFYSYGDAMFIR